MGHQHKIKDYIGIELLSYLWLWSLLSEMLCPKGPFLDLLQI